MKKFIVVLVIVAILVPFGIDALIPKETKVATRVGVVEKAPTTHVVTSSISKELEPMEEVIEPPYEPQEVTEDVWEEEYEEVEVERDLVAEAWAIIDTMPTNLKEGLQSVQLSTPETNIYNYNSDAYVIWFDIYIMTENAISDYVMYHEMGHIFANQHNLLALPEMQEAFEEEWSQAGVYGSKNMHEAIAETVAHIYTGSPIPYAPKTMKIVKLYLGME